MLDRLIDEERVRRLHGEASPTVPLAAPEGQLSLFGEGSLAWTERAVRENPTFHNAVTVSSVAELVQTDPANFIEAVAPTLLLLIMANQDGTVSPDLTRQAFERAGDPKQLIGYDGDHYDVYDIPETAQMAAEAARRWFATHLAART
jgi:uncharacterized protein